MAGHNDDTVQMDEIFQINDDENSTITQSYYYDLDEFNNLIKMHNSDINLSILNLNARSLVKNFNEFSAILSSFPSLIDAITVEETWLSESLEPLVQLKDYTFISKHRNKLNRGGGIGIYIKKDLTTQLATI